MAGSSEGVPSTLTHTQTHTQPRTVHTHACPPYTGANHTRRPRVQEDLGGSSEPALLTEEPPYLPRPPGCSGPSTVHVPLTLHDVVAEAEAATSHLQDKGQVRRRLGSFLLPPGHTHPSRSRRVATGGQTQDPERHPGLAGFGLSATLPRPPCLPSIFLCAESEKHPRAHPASVSTSVGLGLKPSK